MTTRLEAAVFDLDGVITRTERVHFAAWKELFDDFLAARGGHSPFTEHDYRTFVDGRPRLDGVRAFLASRGMEDAGSDTSTVQQLGDRKNQLFAGYLDELGVDVDDEAVRLVKELKAAGVPVAVATSSKNGGRVLERAGLVDLFDDRVDGILSERLGLRGKPAPDIFSTGLERLGHSDARRALGVEDAPAGVEAIRAAGFGLVLGVDRDGAEEDLYASGADVVIDDFAPVTLEWIEAQLTQTAAA